MNYARIFNAIVYEVIDFDPKGRFTPEVAALFVPVADTVAVGDTRNQDGSFTSPPPPPAPPAGADAILAAFAKNTVVSGASRQARVFKRLAKIDPLAALTLKG